jgi:hypothetical protein
VELTKAEFSLIRDLHESGVLQDVKTHLIDQEQGAIIVTCSDGDQFYDIFNQHVAWQAGQRPNNPRVHVLANHGGPFAYAPCSPIHRVRHTDKVLVPQIADARAMKGINTVVLHGHAKCGAANLANTSIEQCIALQMRAKANIKTLNHGIVVVPFFQVDYGSWKNGEKHSYFFSRPDWEVWAHKHGVPAIA